MDFSFVKGNNLVSTDDLESPTMMPSSDLRRGSTAAPSTSEPYDQLHALQISPRAIAAKAPDVPFLQASRAKEDAVEMMPPPKPRIRAKIPLEKGYSQMDWLKLTESKFDLAGLKGRSTKRLLTMEEVKLHNTDEDAWTVLRGRVYNISPYLRFHPGGRDYLIKGAGKDCTTLFNKYHAWVNAEFLLEKCLVGILDVTPVAVAAADKTEATK